MLLLFAIGLLQPRRAPTAYAYASRARSSPLVAAIAEDLVPGEYLYSILGVARDATRAEIRKVIACAKCSCSHPLTVHPSLPPQAYRQQARLLHPDVGRADDAQQFRRLSAAYEILVSSRRADWHREDAANKRRSWSTPAPRPRSAGAPSGHWDWVLPVCTPWAMWWLFLYVVRL